MREYTGPKYEVHRVAFVPGDPPRLAAAVNNAVYLWDLGRADPVAELRWDETAWGDPVLSVSPDGRWLVAGPAENLRIWDLAARPPRAQHPLAGPGLFLAEFVTEPAWLTVVSCFTNGKILLFHRADLPIASAGEPRISRRLPTEFELTDELAALVS